MNDTEGREHGEMLAIYEQTVGDIERAKQWGWQLTYSCVLAQFGLLTVANMLNKWWLTLLLAAIIPAIGGLASDHIRQSERSLARFRGRLTRCYKEMPEMKKRVLRPMRKEKPRWPMVRSVAYVSVLTFVLMLIVAYGQLPRR